jgi:hypothetical protein
MSQGWYRNGGSERSIGIACSMQYLLGQGDVVGDRERVVCRA